MNDHDVVFYIVLSCADCSLHGVSNHSEQDRRNDKRPEEFGFLFLFHMNLNTMDE